MPRSACLPMHACTSASSRLAALLRSSFICACAPHGLARTSLASSSLHLLHSRSPVHLRLPCAPAFSRRFPPPKQPPILVSEYCVRGSLYDILCEARTSPSGPTARQLDWPRRLRLAAGCAMGGWRACSFSFTLLLARLLCLFGVV